MMGHQIMLQGDSVPVAALTPEVHNRHSTPVFSPSSFLVFSQPTQRALPWLLAWRALQHGADIWQLLLQVDVWQLLLQVLQRCLASDSCAASARNPLCPGL
jgi:hypothetical protein